MSNENKPLLGGCGRRLAIAIRGERPVCGTYLDVLRTRRHTCSVCRELNKVRSEQVAEPTVLPVTEDRRSELLARVSVLSAQARDVFDEINGALLLAGHASDENLHASAHPQRWLQAARMDVQTGLMKLGRAIKNPPAW